MGQRSFSRATAYLDVSILSH